MISCFTKHGWILICFIRIMNQSLHKVDQGLRRSGGAEEAIIKREKLMESHLMEEYVFFSCSCHLPHQGMTPVTSHSHHRRQQLLIHIYIYFFKPMAKNNPTFALNVYNIVLGWFENIQYIYLDFEVVVFKLRDLQLLPQVLSNSNTTKKSNYWYY